MHHRKVVWRSFSLRKPDDKIIHTSWVQQCKILTHTSNDWKGTPKKWKVSYGGICIYGSPFVKCYTIIFRKIHADLTTLFSLTNPLMTMNNSCLSRNSPVAVRLRKLLRVPAAAKPWPVPGPILRCLWSKLTDSLSLPQDGWNSSLAPHSLSPPSCFQRDLHWRGHSFFPLFKDPV